MKATVPAMLAVFAFEAVSLAGANPRTIVTRDHQVYEKAAIVDRDGAFVTISYDAGVVRVALEDLPADIQNALGYVSKTAESSKPAMAPQASPLAAATPATADRPNAASAVASAPAGISRAPAPVLERIAPPPSKTFTQAKANALYGLKESAILKKWGKPLRVEEFTDLNQRKVKVLIYDEDESTGTKFLIYEKDGFVSGGYCNGKMIRSPKGEAGFDKARVGQD